ncbi:MAG: histidine phosphatase family protein [Nitrospirae bacterium]|nr:histidine phosphatase family protein [Nitrospirota bacterium]
MVTKLYLIRHGETEGAETRRYKGHIDVPLSQKGIEQMKRVAEYLRGDQDNSPIPLLSKRGQKMLDAVYCSDLSRAVKSAEIIAGPHGLKPIIMPELRERNFGLWEGMSFDEIKAKWPDAFNSWAANPLKFSPMNGESTIELRDRALRAFEKILSHNTEHIPPTQPSPLRGVGKGGGGISTIAIVSHGGINRILLCEFLGIPLENIFRIEQDFAAISLVEFHDSYPVTKFINYTI